jgi:hypothetical protein
MPLMRHLLPSSAWRERVLADEAPFGMPGDQRAPILEAPEIISYRGAGFPRVARGSRRSASIS